MKENAMTSVVAVSWGILGGASKSMANMLSNISFENVIEVAIYAALSALVGLLIKEAFNIVKKLSGKLKKKKK